MKQIDSIQDIKIIYDSIHSEKDNFIYEFSINPSLLTYSFRSAISQIIKNVNHEKNIHAHYTLDNVLVIKTN